MGAIKGLRIALGIILVLVLGVSVWLTVQRQVLHQEEISLGSVTLVPVEEDAMAPALREGDLAVAVSRAGEEPPYGLGDAVLCRDGTLTRLVGAVDGDFIVRGDSQGEGEEVRLSPAELQGEVAASLPGAGRIAVFLGSPWGLAAVLVVGILLLALPSLLGLGREPRERPPREQPGKYRPRH